MTGLERAAANGLSTTLSSGVRVRAGNNPVPAEMAGEMDWDPAVDAGSTSTVPAQADNAARIIIPAAVKTYFFIECNIIDKSLFCFKRLTARIIHSVTPQAPLYLHHDLNGFRVFLLGFEGFLDFLQRISVG